MDFIYNQAKYLLAAGTLDLLNDNIAAILVSVDYTGANATPNADVLDSGAAGNVASYELTTATVTGYARVLLTGRAAVETDASNTACFVASNTTFTSLASGNTVGGVILIKDTGANTTSPLIAFFDITNTPTNGGDITIQWANTAGGGIISLT